VLDRPRLSRSQFVFTQVKGREAIFWQTQKTARAANPCGRISCRQPLPDAVTIAVDTRERYPYRFPPARSGDGAGDRSRTPDTPAPTGANRDFRPLQRQQQGIDIDRVYAEIPPE
jgi:hypothetical protein